MAQTFCELEEVSLVNIISISEARLQRNFQVILKALAGVGQRFAGLELRTVNHEKRSEVAMQELSKRLEAAETAGQKLAVQQNSLCQNIQAMEIGIRSQRNQLEQKLAEVQSRFQQSVTLLEKDAARVKEELIVLQTQEKKLTDVINMRNQKTETEMERVRKEIGSLVVKSEHISKKVKVQEQKLEKVEVQTINNMNNTQKTAEEIAVRLISQMAPGGIEGVSIGSGRDFNGRSSKTFLQGSDPSQPQTAGGSSLPSLLKQNMQRRSEDPQGLARSVSQLRERMEIQQANVNKNINKFSETFTKELADIKILKTQLRKESKEKSEMNSSYLLEKIQEIRPELNRLFSRIDTSDDRSNFLERRMEQARKSIAELTAFAKQNSMTRYDEKLKQIQTEFFSQLRQLTGKVDLKTNSTEFVKACQGFEQRFRQVVEFLNTKCEKLEVKKALLFIESKIKEIILVISEDEENEKDALLTKKNIKCISCDKELDRCSGLVNSQSRNWNQMPMKELQPEHLGKFGITKFGSLVKKLKKLEGSELPVLRNRKDQ